MLLLDQNMPPRLVRNLSDIYPHSQHVRNVGLHEASDQEIWEYAKLASLAIVSKDNDFQQRSLLFGFPPKVIWIRAGNCSALDLAVLLRKHSPVIHTFLADRAQSYLILP